MVGWIGLDAQPQSRLRRAALALGLPSVLQAAPEVRGGWMAGEGGSVKETLLAVGPLSCR